MSKIAILGDTHFGCHNSSIVHHEYMKKFFDDFFMYLDQNNIKTVIQLGDLFDVRKHINTWSLNFFRQVFLSRAIEHDIRIYVILGNHDIYYRESLQISSVEEILHDYQDWFVIVKEPADYIIEDQTFFLVPWICKENESAASIALKKSTSNFCAGHFEFNGFELFKGHPAKTSRDHGEYSKFKQVYSGHYHHMSTWDNVLYTGTPYELTWQDCNTTKGFFVLDTDKTVLIENKHTLYSSITLTQQTEIDRDAIYGKFVRIKVDYDLDVKQRERLIDKIQSMQPINLKLIERALVSIDESSDDTPEQNKTYNPDTSVTEIITDYVSNVSIANTIDRDTLKSMLLTIYSEASSAS